MSYLRIAKEIISLQPSPRECGLCIINFNVKIFSFWSFHVWHFFLWSAMLLWLGHSVSIHVIEFSNLVDLWVTKIKKSPDDPLCTYMCCTLRSSEQSMECRSHSEYMWKVCQNNKIVHDYQRKSLGAQRYMCMGFYFLDCAFRMLG